APSRLLSLPLPLFRPTRALVVRELAMLQAHHGILFSRRSARRHGRHCHELSQPMTPRANGVGVSRLHHLTFPVADQTGAPDEYLAGPWVTSRSRRLVLTFSCGAWIARHGDSSMD